MTLDERGSAREASIPPQPVTESVPATKTRSRAGAVGSFALRYGMVWVLVVLIVVAQALYPTLLTADNLRNVMSQNAPAGMIAVGMTFVIIAGGFDLSVGAIYGIGAVTFAKMSADLPLAMTVVVVAVVGLLAGVVNGLIVTKLRVNPFVATLGTSSLFLGGAFIYSDNYPVQVQVGYDWLGSGDIGGIPVSGLIMALVFTAGGVLLSWTTFGQAVRAVGGSEEAARLAGLRVNLVRCATYMLTGVLAALAGSIDTSKLSSGQADQGATLPLLTIAIVILGGTSLSGGEGAIWRTVVGLLIMATMTNLLDSLAVTNAVQLLAQGAVLILAVSFDVLARGAARRGAVVHS